MCTAGDLGLPVRKNLAGHLWYRMSVTGRIVSWAWMALFPLAILVWWRTRWWYAAAILLFAIWVTGPIDDWQCAVIRTKVLSDPGLFDEAYAMGLVTITVGATLADRWIAPPQDWRMEIRRLRAVRGVAAQQ